MIRSLVERVYAGLGSGDRDALLAVLSPDFEAEVAAGLPHGLGGRIHGAEAMIDDVWWAIGARYAMRPEPDEWVACADGRLLVCGTYRGRERATEHVVEAAFDHLWTARGDQLVALRHVTDTVRWTG
jgi:ketosteroid isomerase-like protein